MKKHQSSFAHWHIYIPVVLGFCPTMVWNWLQKVLNMGPWLLCDWWPQWWQHHVLFYFSMYKAQAVLFFPKTGGNSEQSLSLLLVKDWRSVQHVTCSSSSTLASLPIAVFLPHLQLIHCQNEAENDCCLLCRHVWSNSTSWETISGAREHCSQFL